MKHKREELNKVFDQLPKEDQERLLSIVMDDLIGYERRRVWFKRLIVAEVFLYSWALCALAMFFWVFYVTRPPVLNIALMAAGPFVIAFLSSVVKGCVGVGIDNKAARQ